MTFSHRDHRARRELRHLYISFGVAVGALSLVAISFPLGMVRLLAVVGLAVSGTLYVVAVDRLSDRYRQDLSAVRGGEPVSGAVRAEVYHEIGFEVNRGDDWTPSPHHRRRQGESPPPSPETPGGASVPTPSPRSDPPSDGS
jgi:hypothetical protein